MIYVVSCHPEILKYFTNKNDLEVSSLISSTPESESAVLTLLSDLPRLTNRARNGVCNGIVLLPFSSVVLPIAFSWIC